MNANCPECPAPHAFLASRILDDGRILALLPLLFDRARLTLGTGWLGYDKGY